MLKTSEINQIALDKPTHLWYNLDITNNTTWAFNQETNLIQCKSKTVAVTGDEVKNRDMTKTDAEQYNTDTWTANK